jgi:hypothetical protein
MVADTPDSSIVVGVRVADTTTRSLRRDNSSRMRCSIPGFEPYGSALKAFTVDGGLAGRFQIQ